MRKLFIGILLGLVAGLATSCGASLTPDEVVPTFTASTRYPTLTPTPTMTLEPLIVTPTPEVPRVVREDLVLEQLDTIPPEDILEEISYYVGGGGGPCYWGGSEPYIDFDPQDTVLTYESQMITCEWEEGKTLDTTIIAPDGRIFHQQVTSLSHPSHIHTLRLRPRFDDPEGLYTLRVSQGEVTLESNVYYRKPATAVLYYDRETSELHLSNFLPGERIRLLVYRTRDVYGAVFLGSKEYVVDEVGGLVIRVPESDEYYYTVLASSSMEVPDGRYAKLVHQDEENAKESWRMLAAKNDEHRQCPPDVESRILGREAGGLRLRTMDLVTPMYANPRTDSRLVLNVELGSLLMMAKTSHYCSEGAIWWQVFFFDGIGLSGFIMERDASGAYFVEVVTAETASCGELVSRLYAGNWAQVAYTDGTPMNMREAPGLTNSIITKIPEGTRVWLSSGPACVEDSTWWKAHTEAGLEGWLAEYQGSIFYLEPIP